MLVLLTDLWNTLAPGLPTLLGVIVGGFITYLTTQTLETQKWKQQKKDKFLDDRRRALRALMAWIQPMYDALDKAKYAFWIYMKDWYSDWPDLEADLAKLELDPSFRVMLPGGAYEEALPILKKFGEIRELNLQMNDELKALLYKPRSPMRRRAEKLKPGFEAKGNQEFALLTNMITEYWHKLQAAYLATYDLDYNPASFRIPPISTQHFDSGWGALYGTRGQQA